MKREVPQSLVVAVIAAVALIAAFFVLRAVNPPAPRTPQEAGGGAPVSTGPGGLAPIGQDGKPVDEGAKGK